MFKLNPLSCVENGRHFAPIIIGEKRFLCVKVENSLFEDARRDKWFTTTTNTCARRKYSRYGNETFNVFVYIGEASNV